MIEKIITSTLTCIITMIIGYLVGQVKHKKQDYNKIKDDIKILKKANLSQIKSSLTNTFYAYDEIHNTQGFVPEYIQENWIEEYDNYKELGGNHYMEALYNKVLNWTTKKTHDIIK